MRRGKRIGVLLIAVLVAATAIVLVVGRTAAIRGERKLKAALQGVTLLRVRSGGTCHRHPDTEKVLLEEKDTAAIARLVSHIRITSIGGHCMCCGNPTLEFYRGDQLVVTLGFHHGERFRWPGQWKGDGELAVESQADIIRWLADRGVTGPRDEIQYQEAQALARQRKAARATHGFSPTLRQAFDESSAAFAAALRSEFPEPADQVRVLFQVLGASNGSWSMLEWVEQRADELLRQYEPEVLAAAIERALRGDNRQVRRGAARFWQSWRSPLEGWQPTDAPALHRVVIAVQRECRYYPERQSVLRNLQRWQQELDPAEVTQLLRAGLHDPHPSVRRQAMLVAGQMKHAASLPHLRDVLLGKSVEPIALPDVPPAEQEDVSEGFDDVASNRPEPEVAALALGWIGDGETVPLLRSRQSEAPMYAVALAMLGQPELLAQEHFQSNNQALQLAAVEAVVRCRGRVGLELALGYQTATHWWEEEHVAGQLRLMLLANAAPGTEMLQTSRTLKELRGWFDRWGRDYLAKQTASTSPSASRQAE